MLLTAVRLKLNRKRARLNKILGISEINTQLPLLRSGAFLKGNACGPLCTASGLPRAHLIDTTAFPFAIALSAPEPGFPRSSKRVVGGEAVSPWGGDGRRDQHVMAAVVSSG